MNKVKQVCSGGAVALLWRLIESYAGASAVLFIIDQSEPQFVSLLVFLLLFWILKPEKNRPGRAISLTAGVLAVFFALATVCARYSWLKEEYGFFSSYTAYMAFMCWIFYRAMLVILYRKLAPASLTRGTVAGKPSPVRIFLLAFMVLVLVYTFCFLCHFPGNVMADTRTQLAQIVGLDPYSNHHPMAHTLSMKVFFDLGMALFHTENAGVACITVSQYLMVAAVFAYALSTMERFRVGRWMIWASLAFFALAPNNLLFSITIVKDVPFAVMTLLMLTCLWRLLGHSGGVLPKRTWPDWALFILGCLGVCVLRTNGIYAFIVFIPLCALLLPRKNRDDGKAPRRAQRWQILAAMAGALTLALIFRGPVLTSMGVTPPDAIESLSVPAQHIARVVTDGCELSKEEYDLLSQIVDVEKIPETYESYIADPIKELVRAKGNQAYLTAHKGEYFRLWLELGLRYPKEYLFSQIDETVGFWYPNISYTSLYLGGIHPESTRLDIATTPVIKGEGAALLNAWLTGGHIWPVYGLVYCIGTATWIAVAFFGLSLVRRRRWALLPSLFLFLVFGTLLVATPVHAEFRYLYSLFVSLPLLIALAFTGDGGEVE